MEDCGALQKYLALCANQTKNFDPKELVARTEKGCDATIEMKPRAGRASYVGIQPNCPDPGASAFTLMVKALMTLF